MEYVLPSVARKISYSSQQSQLIADPEFHKFCEGIPGTGKTTAALAYLENLAYDPGSNSEILILTPQRSLGDVFRYAFENHNQQPYKPITVTTYAGISRQMVRLFWPLIAGHGIFANKDVEPTFLSIETTIYHLNKLITPLIDEGYFNSITIERHLLLSQIIDNLNKSSLVGIPLSEITFKLLKSSVAPERVSESLSQTQHCMDLFRAYCLQHTLVDYSLQIDLFKTVIQNHPLFQEYFFSKYQHLIVDNVEEETPVAHDSLIAWIPNFLTSLVIKNSDSGYRYFLGADPVSADRLKASAGKTYYFDDQFVTSPLLENSRYWLSCSLNKKKELSDRKISTADIYMLEHTYPHEQVEAIASEISTLVNDQNIDPSKIVILAPYVTDSIQYFFQSHFDRLSIPFKSVRPSTPLSDEPIIKDLFTISKIAHPEWGLTVNTQDIALMLSDFIDELDYVRAHLLAITCFQPKNNKTPFSPFNGIKADMQARISAKLGQRFEKLGTYINAYINNGHESLNIFLVKLFEEVLVQQGFRFNANIDFSSKLARLCSSYDSFISGLPQRQIQSNLDLNHEFIKMHEDKVFSPFYPDQFQNKAEPSILFAPITSFLQMNLNADYQFWLDIGSPAWWERIYQPLTHPHVLSRQWQPDTVWTDDHEYAANQEKLISIVSGLMWRCRKNIYLCHTSVSELGSNLKGPLLQAMNRLIYLSILANEEK